MNVSEDNPYEVNLHLYGEGFDELMIRELCRVLTPQQVELFYRYLEDRDEQWH